MSKEDYPQIMLDEENLKSLEKNMKDAFYEKMDRLHMEFLDTCGRELTPEEDYIVRQSFKFIKRNY